MEVVWEMFPERLISFRGGELSWPASHPDLTTWDFYKWNYQKAEVFKRSAMILKELNAYERNRCNTAYSKECYGIVCIILSRSWIIIWTIDFFYLKRYFFSLPPLYFPTVCSSPLCIYYIRIYVGSPECNCESKPFRDRLKRTKNVNKIGPAI